MVALWVMIKALINNLACVVFYDERMSPNEAPAGFPHMYQIRHDEDNWTLPIALEKSVICNFWGTAFTRVPINFNSSGYLEIDSCRLTKRFISFRLRKSTILKMLLDDK